MTMFDLRPFKDLGTADFGWLKARYHFSFARYYNPDRTGFGPLLVVNDDRVAAGSGFPMHPHDNMEIITYVRKGAIHHQDTEGHAGSTPAGSVQVMSAGTGLAHSEHADGAEDTVLYQIWLAPNVLNVAPRWDMATFPTDPVTERLRLLVSGKPEDAGTGALTIYQEARVWGGRLAPGALLTQDFGPRAYVLQSAGTLSINGHTMEAGDGAALTNEGPLTIKNAPEAPEAELLVLELPA
jgi:quercetin 2,3-dioxygenase